MRKYQPITLWLISLSKQKIVFVSQMSLSLNSNYYKEIDKIKLKFEKCVFIVWIPSTRYIFLSTYLQKLHLYQNTHFGSISVFLLRSRGWQVAKVHTSRIPKSIFSPTNLDEWRMFRLDLRASTIKGVLMPIFSTCYTEWYGMNKHAKFNEKAFFSKPFCFYCSL